MNALKNEKKENFYFNFFTREKKKSKLLRRADMRLMSDIVRQSKSF